MNGAELSPPERLLIAQECTRLILRFAERNDARDYDAVADMFTEDALFARPTAPDAPIEGRDAIAAQFRARPANKLTRHVCSNVVVDVGSASQASAHSYILLFTATIPEGGALPVKADTKQLLGAYRDRILRCADGVWRFKERRGSLAMSIGD